MAKKTTTGPRTSRVGKRPIELPKGVSIKLSGGRVDVKGPKGALSRALPEQVVVSQEGDILTVTSAAEGRAAPRLQGLARALVANMVHGVSKGYERRLEFRGTGYRAELKGRALVCNLGHSHQKVLNLPAGLEADVPKDSKGQLIILTSADKEVIGQAAATLRSFRPPQPYGGKGVRHVGERVREKAGKAGK